MKLEQQVCSLELAQKLKALGVKQESLFVWIEGQLFFRTELGFYNERGAAVSRHPAPKSAFTVAELGNLIGPAKNRDSMKAYGHIFNVPDTRFVSEIGLLMVMTQPDLAAKMLIYLLENKLLANN